jgi:hypothetical protein
LGGGGRQPTLYRNLLPQEEQGMETPVRSDAAAIGRQANCGVKASLYGDFYLGAGQDRTGECSPCVSLTLTPPSFGGEGEWSPRRTWTGRLPIRIQYDTFAIS